MLRFNFNPLTRRVVPFLAVLLMFSSTAHAQRLYGTNPFNNACGGSLDFSQCGLWELDPVTGAIVDGHNITLEGFTVESATSITTDPTTNEAFAILKVTADSNRRLAKLNVATGVATLVGDLFDKFSSLTFRGGQLYGVTGDGAGAPETLYLLNKTDASKVLATPLGNGADGELIAYNPTNDLIYHWSGNGTVVFESILPDPPYTVTNIPITGSPGGETFGAVWNPATGKFLAHNISNFMQSWSTAGVISDPQAATSGDVRGLALVFVAPTAASARTLAPNSVSKAALGATVPEIWYRAELFANRSYQLSAWLVDHEQGVDGPDLSVTLFSDDAGTIPATGVTGGAAVLEGSPNQAGDAKPTTVIVRPTATGVHKIRVQRLSGAAFHYVNLMLRETTLTSPWTSRGASFEGFIELHNNTDAAVSVTLRGYDSAGVMQGAGLTFSIPANATVFRTATQVGVPVNVFAGIVATHDGAAGAIAGNITTLNPANGLSFDSPFSPRSPTLMAMPVR